MGVYTGWGMSGAPTTWYVFWMLFYLLNTLVLNILFTFVQFTLENEKIRVFEGEYGNCRWSTSRYQNFTFNGKLFQTLMYQCCFLLCAYYSIYSKFGKKGPKPALSLSHLLHFTHQNYWRRRLTVLLGSVLNPSSHNRPSWFTKKYKPKFYLVSSKYLAQFKQFRNRLQLIRNPI